MLVARLFPSETAGRSLPVVKLCDFGWSKTGLDSTPNTFAGTAYYMAPEVYSLQRNTQANYSGQPVDIWTCGVLLLILVQGRYPFEGSGGKDAAILEGGRLAAKGELQPRLVQLTEALQVSQDCIQTLRRMLALSSEDRPTAAQAIQDVQGAWRREECGRVVQRDPWEISITHIWLARGTTPNACSCCTRETRPSNMQAAPGGPPGAGNTASGRPAWWQNTSSLFAGRSPECHSARM